SVLSNWGSVTSGTTWDDPYLKATAVSDISQCLKQIGGDVSWTSEKNRGLSIGLGTLVGSIAEAKALGGGCDPFPPSAWDNPDSFSSFDTNSYGASAGIKGTGIDVLSISGTRYAFISAIHSSPAQADFWIVDITDPENPVFVSKYNSGKGL